MVNSSAYSNSTRDNVDFVIPMFFAGDYIVIVTAYGFGA